MDPKSIEAQMASVISGVVGKPREPLIEVEEPSAKQKLLKEAADEGFDMRGTVGGWWNEAKTSSLLRSMRNVAGAMQLSVHSGRLGPNRS